MRAIAGGEAKISKTMREVKKIRENEFINQKLEWANDLLYNATDKHLSTNRFISYTDLE